MMGEGALPALLNVVAWFIATSVAIPMSVLTVEVLVGLSPARRALSSSRQMRVAVLVPAHNEALGIAATLAALHEDAPAGMRILVVADNCTDETANIARRSGAEVIERHSASERGKGFALAFGRDHLASAGTPPEVVIVLDADCRFAPGSVEALVFACAANPQRPAQAINLIAPVLSASPMVQISGFAMVVKNLYRSRGMQRLGGAALLTGTGMAFPWPLFEKAHLATGSIVEDLGLGIALTRAGHAPILIDGAKVTSEPAASDVALVQRTRWEHGFLDTIRTSALPLLASGLARPSRSEFLLGLHLIVPPLALLLMAAAAALILLSLLAIIGAGIIPLMFSAVVLAAAMTAIFAAWVAGGRRWLTGSALLRAPLYILWKLPIYLNFFRRRETEWQRTPREGE